MKIPVFVMAALCLLLNVSGCAMMDISTLDTAIPVAPADLQVAPYQAIGLDLSSAVYNENDADDKDKYAGVDMASGIKANISLKPDLDLQVRAYTGLESSQGFKIGVKKLIRQETNNYVAFAPAIVYVRQTSEHDKDKSRAYGVEMQLLYTQKWGKTSATVTMRGNYERMVYSEYSNGEYAGIDNKEYDLMHGGLRVNLCWKGKHLYFIPELGIELVPVINGKLSMIPAMGYAIGVEF